VIPFRILVEGEEPTETLFDSLSVGPSHRLFADDTRLGERSCNKQLVKNHLSIIQAGRLHLWSEKERHGRPHIDRDAKCSLLPIGAISTRCVCVETTGGFEQPRRWVGLEWGSSPGGLGTLGHRSATVTTTTTTRLAVSSISPQQAVSGRKCGRDEEGNG
jgi:hypothetical protein